MAIPPLRRIMMVEDEADIRAVAQIALEAVGGFEVYLCGSGPEALESAEEAQPDLILLDVMMPGMDGLTTLSRLRALPEMAETPVVFMTAKVQRHEVSHYLQLGALDVISKPFDPMTLSSTITAIWERHHSAT